MRILAIESTCDETSIALLSGRKLKKNLIYSQVNIHRKYKGVVPEAASRAHSDKIALLLSRSGFLKEEISAVSFSRGPGLNGSLIVSFMASSTVSEFLKVPLIGVNHLEGHLLSCEIRNRRIEDIFKFPIIALIVSGGHSELWLVKGYGKYSLLGATRDDAVGEAFDKTARLLGFQYPGGPLIEKAAAKVKDAGFSFPVPNVPKGFEFSFSGLKTAVSYKLAGEKIISADKYKIAAAFQKSAVEALLVKTLAAVSKYPVRQIAVGGGVSANGYLRKVFTEKMREKNVEVLFPEKKYCGDNAAMVAACAFRRLKAGKFRNCTKPEADLKIEDWN